MCSSRTASAPLPEGNPLKILVVEDHPAMCAAVLSLLSMGLPHAQVLSTGTAEHALLMCDAHAPDVVVMDIALPGMSGIEATRHIRLKHPTIQVVMHSHSDMLVYREEAMKAGAFAFISKGRSSGELVPVIKGLFPALPA